MSRYVVFVESQGKVANIESIFQYLGLNSDVIATQGRLLDFPASESDTNKLINRSNWIPLNEFKYSLVIDQLKSKSEGFILTDMDREGEWCAYELLRLSKAHNCELQRISSHDLSLKGIEKSLNTPLTIDLNLVAEAISHRLLSRLTSNLKSPFPAGKVVTPFLSEVSKLQSSNRVFYNKSGSAVPIYVLDDESFNQDSILEFNIESSKDLEDLEDGVSIEEIYTTLILNYGITPSNIYQSLQEAYMAGIITYPRTSSCSSSQVGGAHGAITICDVEKSNISHDPVLMQVTSLIELKSKQPNDIELSANTNGFGTELLKANRKLVNDSIKFESKKVNKESFSFLVLYKTGLGTAGSYHHHFQRFGKLLCDQNVLSKKGMIALQHATAMHPEFLNLSLIKRVDATLKNCDGKTLNEMVENRLGAAATLLSSKFLRDKKQGFRLV